MLKKEQIRDRMLKTAARLWEIPEGEIETNFDPLILLLLEACAGELEQIGAGISATQNRLIDRLAELILPEAMINAHPGSCIMQAQPVEARAMLDETTRFYTTQRIQQAGMTAYNRDFYFTPVGSFQLLKTNLGYMKAGHKFYRFTASGQKELIGDTGHSGASNELWLALTPEKGLNSFKGLQLFFDLKGHSESDLFYSSLLHAKAYAGEQALSLESGYYKGYQFELNLEEALSGGYHYSRKVHRQVAGVYARQFVNLAGDLQPVPGDMPGAWTGLPEKTLQSLQAEGLVFIRIVLGRMFQQETLDRLHCSINAFPVINRSLNTLHHRTDSRVNIVPMPIEGSFLDLQDVTGSPGGKYRINSSAGGRQVEEGEAIVRHGGVGKTNAREVREIIGSLTEAIRDESAYFSRMSNEFVLARLREITRILARLEDQMQVARDKKEALHYLLLKPKAAGESITVSYWTTNGTEAHVVKAGTSLTAFNHTLTPSRSAFTLTNVTGGKSTISDAEKKYILQRQLASGGKIISAEDVKLLSYQLLGDRIKKIAVRKGVQPGVGPNQGFQRSIDIFLTLAPRHSDSEQDEVGYLCRELEYYLSLHASPVYPFRLVLQ
ncbi:type VI secretion system baseplate subunit TssF [Taibaiella koreensis]|uniref:type VI secretion system baseplate subunit TssF n=1 Tax=Taibaiella koreensis TaxID=1268548 RepID=UPI0013C361DF|nr:type VI secretion system baseplate subunit TssF [Taibaiella koreensis]